MPKFKQPATLLKLSVQALGRTVGQRAVEAIASGIDINTNALQEYLYGELPDVLSQEVTAHMLQKVSRTLINGHGRDVCDSRKRVLLAIVCHRIRVLDLTKAPTYAVETLSCNIQTFKKLHTLILKHFIAADVAETLAAGLSSQKFLAHFQMQYKCTDAIIQTLGSCCYASIQQIDVRVSKLVTDASFKVLLKCRELKRFLIGYTSVTGEGFVQFLQQRKCDDTAKGFLGLAVGSDRWVVSSTHLNAIALCCPLLRRLEIWRLRADADMEELVSLTALEALMVYNGDFHKCNLDAFLHARGSNITLLELVNVQSIDLACILNHCVNITTLYISEGSIMGNLEIDPKACRYLDTLELICEFSPSSIEGMLYACVNLTTLRLVPSEEHITDKLILRVLSKNPLQKFTSFSALCPELTMRSVDAIIEQCPLLQELHCFDCDQMTEAEVEILNQKIKNGNLDLNAGFDADHFPW